MGLVFFRIFSTSSDIFRVRCSCWIFHTPFLPNGMFCQSIPSEEADPLFLEALGDAGGSIIHGEDDRDGRGIQVQSCTFAETWKGILFISAINLGGHCFFSKSYRSLINRFVVAFLGFSSEPLRTDLMPFRHICYWPPSFQQRMLLQPQPQILTRYSHHLA